MYLTKGSAKIIIRTDVAKVNKANKKPLEALTKALLEKETVDEAEVSEILKGAKLPKEVKLHE